MFVFFNYFYYGQTNIPREGHFIDDSKTTFGSTLASFIDEIFLECCPFGNTPFPLTEIPPYIFMIVKLYFEGQVYLRGPLV